MSNIAITGGGTGGHLKIAKVIKDELNKRGIRPIYIGSIFGADMEWFFGDPGFSSTYFLDSKGVVNKKGFDKIIALSNILKNSLKARGILKEHNITKLFSVGGYSSAPASLGSIGVCKLFIHEQNARIGKLNKILKPFSKRFFNTFFYNDPYPIENSFFEYARIRKEIKTIIFLGGSQGALQINNLAMEVAKEINSLGINIIHQTGKRDYKRVKEFYEEKEIEVDVFDFDINLVEKISKADLAISRAGASTLFELTANKLPAIFIPYPYSAGDHQYYNAKWLEEKKAGIVKRDLNKNEFLELLEKIDVYEISKNLADIKLQNGVEKIVDEILEI